MKDAQGKIPIPLSVPLPIWHIVGFEGGQTPFKNLIKMTHATGLIKVIMEE